MSPSKFSVGIYSRLCLVVSEGSSFIANIRVLRPYPANLSISSIVSSDESDLIIRGIIAMSAPLIKFITFPSFSRLTTTDILLRSLVKSTTFRISYFSTVPLILIVMKFEFLSTNYPYPTSRHISKNVISS